VTLATATWLTVLWAVAVAGRLAPRAVEAPGRDAATTRAHELELVGRLD
jgi:hypothetical protein